jgi:hypothetical protein
VWWRRRFVWLMHVRENSASNSSKGTKHLDLCYSDLRGSFHKMADCLLANKLVEKEKNTSIRPRETV